MTYSQQWLIAALAFVALPLATFIILILHTPVVRLTAGEEPFVPPALFLQVDTARSLQLLDQAAPAEAHFARTHNVRVYEANLPSRETFAYNLTGTLDIVLNRSLIGDERHEAVILAHELFHASHRYGWIDLVLPEEERNHLFTQRVAQRLGVVTHQAWFDDLYIWSAPLCLALSLFSSLILWHRRPRFEDLRAALFRTH